MSCLFGSIKQHLLLRIYNSYKLYMKLHCTAIGTWVKQCLETIVVTLFHSYLLLELGWLADLISPLTLKKFNRLNSNYSASLTRKRLTNGSLNCTRALALKVGMRCEACWSPGRRYDSEPSLSIIRVAWRRLSCCNWISFARACY